MAEATFIPQHKLSDSRYSRTIEIADWIITATNRPIINAAETDTLQSNLGFPLPEMTFGNNSLCLKHKPSNWEYTFKTLEALRAVKNGELVDGDGGVKVGYADAWLKSRTDPDSVLPLPETTPTKHYDWTYTSAYPGHCNIQDAFLPAESSNANHTIPLSELTRQDPILFYAEIPLYEDELHDNGSSHFLIRIRVMPGCIFILSRFTLRVDNVLFRAFDTRIYHSLTNSPGIVVRERSGWEAPYEQIKRLLPKKDDLNPLTDHNFIAKSLSLLPSELSQKSGAGTNWRSLGTRLDVAHLDTNSLQSGIENLKL
ncbi:type 2A phosphatase activator TIP41 [Rickenella mellea]|uniref:Type 2A phosphatase activator TIP41 n=1 Tax=Rickenella mellea TaxID=50990 RepID=A0A4R5XEV8_9AGAM|nr:type 2A phosphatase activator TIP41 [Rickenella mellea]